MASRDIVNNVAKCQLLPPQSVTGNFTSKIVDTQGYESVMIVVNAGAMVGFDGSDYLTFTLQESNDTVGADFTNVAATANSLAGTPSATADFGDQDRPFLSSLAGPGGASGSMVTPVAALLPAPGVIPNLYTGLLPLNAETQANAHYSVGYIGSKRYLRLLGTMTGTFTSVVMDVVAYLSHSQQEPILINPSPITAS